MQINKSFTLLFHIIYIILNIINTHICEAKAITASGINNHKHDYTHIKSLRIWGGLEGTRVVFDLSNKVNYKVQTFINPHRIIIDIKQAKLSDKLITDLNNTFNFEKKNNTNNIKKITTSSHSKVLQIILELSEQVNVNNFILEPNERYGHRLVLDLEYIEKEKQKILALFDLDLRNKDLVNKLNINIKPNSASVRSNLDSGMNSKISSIINLHKKLIIAIDPGHGGEDPGAIGPRGTLEKDIVLAIAKILKDEINKSSKMQALLIRDRDYYVSLYNRMLRARLNKADLFLSIHADAISDPKADGGSVFILSEKGASSAAAKWLADTQNRSDTIGGVKIENKRDPLASVLLDLSQTANYTTSMQAAKNILLSMQNTVSLHKYQVEHANFAVLKAPDVPSVLIETGFISNPKTESKLKNFYYQQKIARSIVKGINNYFALQAKKNLLTVKK